MARWRHWLVVLTLTAAYLTAYYRRYFTIQSEPANWYILLIHMNVGVVVLLLTIFMLMRRRPSLSPMIKRNNKLALTMYYALYAMLLLIPTTAYIGTGFDFPLLNMVRVPGFMRFEFIQTWVNNNFEMLITTFMEPFSDFHKYIGTTLIMPVLLLGHIGAASYHHFFEDKQHSL